MKEESLYRGVRFEIRSFELADESCPVRDFLQGLSPSDTAKVANLFALVADHESRNPEKFKKVEGSDGLFEFKSHQIRIFCFFHGKVIYLADAVRKQSDKHRKADIKRAEEYKRWFLSQGG